MKIDPLTERWNEGERDWSKLLKVPSSMARVGLGRESWLLICADVYGLLSIVATRVRGNRPPLNT